MIGCWILHTRRRSWWPTLLLALLSLPLLPWGPAVRNCRAEGEEPANVVGTEEPAIVVGTEVPEDRSAMIPSVTLWREIQAGADSVHIWSRQNLRHATDRTRLFEAIRSLLAQQERLSARTAAVHPQGDVEWMLVLDSVADSLSEAVFPLLTRYREAYPEELLTEGRVALEVELAKIPGAPARVLGLHFVRLGGFIYSRADTLLQTRVTKDRVGLQDGVLRYLADWAELYHQAHKDPLEVYRSRVAQEDWIIARLVDKCGNSGGETWSLVEEWMAEIPDSTVSPPVTRFAHEYRLKAVKCRGDIRNIYIDLPNYREVQKELRHQSELKGSGGAAAPGR